MPQRSITPSREVTLFLCGDVMTGRGIDQILAHPCNPRLLESYCRSAQDYVALAERVAGPIVRPVDFAYIWGDALAELDRMRPAARIINLETAVTVSEDVWPNKTVHYRMNPANVGCLTIAKLDCCVLANNHVMDWGLSGLAETLATLRQAALRCAGAGNDEREARAPAIIEVPNTGRILVFACGTASSGVPVGWAASGERPGVNLLRDCSPRSVESIARQVASYKRDDDVVLLSIHWGSNWGYDIPAAQRTFARDMIDSAGVDVVHGHSSHHVKGIEVYRDKLILYGCGDFIDDYEGIQGYEIFRADLGLMYFPTIDVATGRLRSVRMMPTRTSCLRVNRADERAAEILTTTLNREGKPFGTAVERQSDNALALQW
ncbi:MAG TPA: CapA family protein [Casimicrobiaceae bacterium]|jgi:poly-gamma-glutamate synthesis protein (capsule biosynthesis protein)